MRTSYPPHEPERAVIPYGSDPLDRVLYLGGKATTTILVALVLALGLHGVAAARAALVSLELVRWSRDMQARISDRLVSSYDIEANKVEPPPEPPPPEKEEAPKAPPPPAAANAPPPPPPEAAQAGKILAQEPDPNDPVDLTGGFVSGNGATFTGGVTQAGGTGKTAVYNTNARATGTPGGTGAPQAAPPAPAGPDKTRSAGLSGSSDWKCDWPSEADSEQIDDAFVMVEVLVGPNGRAQKVNILKDPGHGFGRNARTCAMRESFTAPLDREGNAIAGMTKPFRIHFER
jgi:protein TonB